MTKKDFDFLAATLKDQFEYAVQMDKEDISNGKQAGHTRAMTVYFAVVALASAMKVRFPDFDKNRFIAATTANPVTLINS